MTPFAPRLIAALPQLLKYLVSGGIGLCVNLASFHVLNQSGLHYLSASALALLIALAVGFVLQKFWTFADHSLAQAHVQFLQYAFTGLFSLAISTSLVYLLVEQGGLYPLFAQAGGAGAAAVATFFVYRLYIFRIPAPDSASLGTPV